MMRIAAAYKFDSLRFPSQEICSRSAAGWGEMAAPAAIVTLRLLGECDHSSTGIPACANVTMQRDRGCLARARLRSLLFSSVGFSLRRRNAAALSRCLGSFAIALFDLCRLKFKRTTLALLWFAYACLHQLVAQAGMPVLLNGRALRYYSVLCRATYLLASLALRAFRLCCLPF
jgi:hypothetical protein